MASGSTGLAELILRDAIVTIFQDMQKTCMYRHAEDGFRSGHL